MLAGWEMGALGWKCGRGVGNVRAVWETYAQGGECALWVRNVRAG